LTQQINDKASTGQLDIVQGQVTALQANIDSGTTFSAIDALDQAITDDSTGLTALQSKITELNANVDSDRGFNATAREGLTQNISDTESDLSIVQGHVVSLTARLDSGGTTFNAIDALDQAITDDSTGLSALQSKITELNVNLESGTTFTAIDALDQAITDDSTGLSALQSKITQLNVNLESGATFTAIDGLQSQITDDSTGLSALQSKITQLQGNLDSDIGAEASARSALELTIKKDSDILSIVNSAIDSFETTLLFDSAGTANSLVNSAKSELRLEIIDSAGIYSISTSAIDSFETALLDSTGVIGSIATAQAGLVQRVNGNSDELQTINQKYFVALDDGNTFTGFEVINGDSVSSFTIQANDFALKTQNQTMTPFSVSGDVVSLTNTKVTGDLDIGTGAANSMKLTDDVLKIHDSDGNVRVIIGNLSG
jgi:hypothetical protein